MNHFQPAPSRKRATRLAIAITLLAASAGATAQQSNGELAGRVAELETGRALEGGTRARERSVH